MQAECHQQLGEYADAIELYENSLKLYMQWIDWDTRTQFPPIINPDNSAWQQARITWGTPKRQTSIANIPSLNVLFGNTDAENLRVVQQGGVLQQAVFRTVDMPEIMRCTALRCTAAGKSKARCVRKTPQPVNTSRHCRPKPAPSASFPAVWNGVLLGIAQASAGRLEEGFSTLQNSLQYNRTMDHSLTPIALLDMANIAMAKRNMPKPWNFTWRLRIRQRSSINTT